MLRARVMMRASTHTSPHAKIASTRQAWCTRACSVQQDKPSHLHLHHRQPQPRSAQPLQAPQHAMTRSLPGVHMRTHIRTCPCSRACTHTYVHARAHVHAHTLPSCVCGRVGLALTAPRPYAHIPAPTCCICMLCARLNCCCCCCCCCHGSPCRSPCPQWAVAAAALEHGSDKPSSFLRCV